MKDEKSFATLSYDGPPVLKANQLFQATLTVNLNMPMSTGGRVMLATRHMSDFGDPQMMDSKTENYITVVSSREGSELVLGAPNDWKRHPWNRGIELVLAQGKLEAGDRITVSLGIGEGCPGYRCQSFMETSFRFRLGVDPDGMGDKWRVLPTDRCPGFQIVGNLATTTKVFVPQCTAPGVDHVLMLKPEDIYGNVSAHGPSALRLLLDDVTPLAEVSVADSPPLVSRVDLPVDGSWHVVTASTDDGAVYERSNPFGPSPVDGYQLYWGEIHSQSSRCDGTNSPAELYDYARFAAGLDFASVTSHDFELTSDDWEAIKRETKAAHRPGEFVTFLGYEWSGTSDQGGDNNIYFLDDDAPLLYSAPWDAHPGWDPAEGQVPGSQTLTDVIRKLAGTQFMVIPHCGGRRCNFDFYDPGAMPLFEVHSCHRTYDHVLREAVDRGLQFGLIGGSDDHRGAIGDSHPTARDRYFSSHNGLVGVYAKELTRDALWEAFFARRVYATNGIRMALDVRLGDVLMGGTIEAEVDSVLPLKVWAHADGLVDRVEICKGNETIAHLGGKAQSNKSATVDDTIEIRVEAGVNQYFVRLFQAGGGRAWSSPIRVTGR